MLASFCHYIAHYESFIKSPMGELVTNKQFVCTHETLQRVQMIAILQPVKYGSTSGVGCSMPINYTHRGEICTIAPILCLIAHNRRFQAFKNYSNSQIATIKFVIWKFQIFIQPYTFLLFTTFATSAISCFCYFLYRFLNMPIPLTSANNAKASFCVSSQSKWETSALSNCAS